MTAFEIILVLIGLILFVGSFFVSEKITATKEQLKVAIDEVELKKLLQVQINSMDDDITQLIVDNIENSTDGVKRSMEKLSNEKIMAIDEYSNGVMEAIQKNHNEVMFLYGMLNDKNKEIKETAELITKANKGMNKKFSEASDLIERMESQIVFLNQYEKKQTMSMERIEKSTQAIETLEEQLNRIERMAIQFSRDINDVNVGHSDENEIYFGIEVNHEDDAKLVDSSVESIDSDIEEILEHISSDAINLENIPKDSSNYNQVILDMSKKGHNALEIAKTLGLGVGEVQLVIDLFEGSKR